jgi:RNA polymerase sigma factor (sigma-70 family)
VPLLTEKEAQVGFSVDASADEDLDEVLLQAQGCDSDDSPAMNEIIRRFEQLTLKIASRATNCMHMREDIANASRWGLAQAVRSHTRGTPGFPNYAKRYMQGAALRELGQLTRDDHALVDMSKLADEPVPQAESAIDVSDLVSRLRPDQQRLLHARYARDLPLQVIAADLGVTNSAVCQRLRTIHGNMRRWLTDNEAA